MISYANGQFIATEDVAIPVDADTLGSIRGLRIFTTGLVVDGKVSYLHEHVKRLINSGNRLGFLDMLPADKLAALIEETAQRNHDLAPEKIRVIKIILSGGKAGSKTAQAVSCPLLYIMVSAFVRPPEIYYEKGVSVATFPYQRDLPDVKLTYYIGSLLAQENLTKYEADYPVFVTPEEPRCFLEGDTFSVFFVKNNTIYTPVTNGRILEGITRQSVITIAKNYYKVCEQNVLLSSISDYDEAFLTSSIRQVMPIVKIDGQVIGTGKPGLISSHLRSCL
ncbi:MAG: hypothetical protein EXS67_01620 [Candidatus Margulisbacteria bacterium]|nr:hypothetical protein [Candidatus Margulisiibacteriota bacterium]